MFLPEGYVGKRARRKLLEAIPKSTPVTLSVDPVAKAWAVLALWVRRVLAQTSAKKGGPQVFLSRVLEALWDPSCHISPRRSNARFWGPHHPRGCTGRRRRPTRGVSASQPTAYFPGKLNQQTEASSLMSPWKLSVLSCLWAVVTAGWAASVRCSVSRRECLV